MQCFGIIVGGLFDSGNVLIQPRTVKACLIQVLRGSYKSSGFALHGGTKGAEVAARLWGQEQENLLCALRHCNDDPFLTCLLFPRFGFGERVIWWGIRGPAEKSCVQQRMSKLILGKPRMRPNPVPRMQFRNRRKRLGRV